MKHLIVGTKAGHVAAYLRDVWQHIRADKDDLGMLANNQLATHYVTRLCTPGKTFVDVGAHLGSMIAEAKAHCAGIKIIGIEAVPEKAERLRQKFRNVEIVNCAVDAVEREVSFFVDLKEAACSSLAPSQNPMREISIPARRLDSIVEADDVDVMKIDVEGAELGVLRGGEGMIARCRPTIMFESGPADLLGYSKGELFDWFEAHDYAVLIPNRLPHAGPPLSRGGFLESHEYPFRTLNYFGVAVERMDEIRRRAGAIAADR